MQYFVELLYIKNIIFIGCFMRQCFLRIYVPKCVLCLFFLIAVLHLLFYFRDYLIKMNFSFKKDVQSIIFFK